jgi:hypothetical protein
MMLEFARGAGCRIDTDTGVLCRGAALQEAEMKRKWG